MHKNILFKILSSTLLAYMLYTQSVFAENINLMDISHGNSKYIDGLIKLALSYNEKQYSFTYETEALYTPRILELFESGRITIFWAATTKEYEEKYRPIFIPLFRGLLGYRVMLIREGDQYRFNHIKTFDDLFTIKLGQGRYWTDTEIMEANGLKIIQTRSYDGLFHMLDGGRFDAFPRGIQEPWAEISSRPDLSLAVEENLILVYRMPFYLFLTKNNERLAQELETGLLKALEDGSYERYFFNDPTVKEAIAKVDLKNRTYIHLKNPLLSDKTPLNRKEFWLNPKDL